LFLNVIKYEHILFRCCYVVARVCMCVFPHSAYDKKESGFLFTCLQYLLEDYICFKLIMSRG